MANNTNQAGFDPKAFLAIVGEGKTILEFGKDQVVFAQGDAADTVFYIQKGRVKVVVISEQGKEAVVGILAPGQFWRRLHERPFAAYRDGDSDGGLPGHRDNEDGHAPGASRPAEVFRVIHGVSADPQ